MRIYESLDQFNKLTSATVTIGTFDGVHLGHQKLLQHLRTCAKKTGSEAVVITFWPHPRTVLAPTHAAPIGLLTTFEEKATIIAQQGIEHLIKLPFNKDFAQLSAQDFIQQILLKQVGMTQVILGHDHSFGKDRVGNVMLLKEMGLQHGFTVEEVAPVMIDNLLVNATSIRKLLLVGDIEKVNKYLGRPYEVRCTVFNTHCARGGGMHVQLATQVPHKLIPTQGRYAVSISCQGTFYQNRLYIKKDMGSVTIEAHIPELEEAPRAHNLCIYFQERLSINYDTYIPHQGRTS